VSDARLPPRIAQAQDSVALKLETRFIQGLVDAGVIVPGGDSVVDGVPVTNSIPTVFISKHHGYALEKSTTLASFQPAVPGVDYQILSTVSMGTDAETITLRHIPIRRPPNATPSGLPASLFPKKSPCIVELS
jgi:hypothetical protein